MRGPIDLLKYLIGSATGNTSNMVRAGRNNAAWGFIGGAIVGAVLGSPFPVVGQILGAFVGGLLGSTIAWGLS